MRCVRASSVACSEAARVPSPARCAMSGLPSRRSTAQCRLACSAQKDTADRPTEEEAAQKSPEEMTQKWGLEAGLLSALRQGAPGKASAKDLLKRYGGAYLITSISLTVVSLALCYVAVDSGLDVPAILAKIKITVSSDSVGERAGTFALAYAAHKALSPVRFPPTVALTPFVAKWLGKDKGEAAADEQ